MYENLISLSKNKNTEVTEKNIQLQTYYSEIHKDCPGEEFIDKGYYYRHNGEYYICKEEKQADFRLLECTICHKELMIFNNGKIGWDNVPFLPIDPKKHHIKVKQ